MKSRPKKQTKKCLYINVNRWRSRKGHKKMKKKTPQIQRTQNWWNNRQYQKLDGAMCSHTSLTSNFSNILETKQIPESRHEAKLTIRLKKNFIKKTSETSGTVGQSAFCQTATKYLHDFYKLQFKKKKKKKRWKSAWRIRRLSTGYSVRLQTKA